MIVMKKIPLIFLIATCLSTAKAQELPDKSETLKTLTTVNEYFMKKYEDYTQPLKTDKVRPSNIWTRGVYYEGLMELYKIYPQENYYEYAYGWECLF